MRLSIRLAALALPMLFVAPAMAGDPPLPPIDCENVVWPQLHEDAKCHPGKDLYKNPALKCFGLLRLAKQMGPSKHVRSCELRFERPIIEHWITIRAVVNKAPKSFRLVGTSYDRVDPGGPKEHTQVTMTVESPERNKWSGDEEILVYFEINGRLPPPAK